MDDSRVGYQWRLEISRNMNRSCKLIITVQLYSVCTDSVSDTQYSCRCSRFIQHSAVVLCFGFNRDERNADVVTTSETLLLYFGACASPRVTPRSECESDGSR